MRIDMKKQERSRVGIWKMFDQISPTYDKANRVMTLGLDQVWRRKMAYFLPDKQGQVLLDCATGTADQLISFMEGSDKVGQAIGIDLAQEMLAVGKKKMESKPYGNAISFQVASALDLPFEDAMFDCVAISFGIRNVTDVRKALSEFYRVLQKKGRVLILEGTVPKNFFLKKVHLFYLRNILPRVGGTISNNLDAYRYLNETIETFPSGEKFCKFLRAAGFKSVKAHPLTGGIATIYVGDKG